MIKAVCENAKVEYKSPHAFRRGNITALLIDLGLPERVVGARTGQLSQGQLLGVYCQAAEGVDKKYVPKIAELLYGGEE